MNYLSVQQQTINYEPTNITEKIKYAFNAIATNSMFNSYVLENAAMNRIYPYEKIPFDMYAKELCLHKSYIYRKCIEGKYIDDKERLKNINKETILFDFFSHHMLNIFEKKINSKYDNVYSTSQNTNNI